MLDEYTRLTGRPFQPPEWALRHWRWRGELAVGEPAELDGAAVNAQVAEDLRMYERFGIPAGVYLIDRPWSEGEFGFESFRWDEKRLPNPEAMLAALARRGWRLALWSAAFAVGENLEIARAHGYLAPGSDLVLDLTNPDARAWWKREHVAFARRWNVAAIKLDRGEEQIPSEATDVWFDGRSGRELRNAYPVLQLALYQEILREARGDDFLVIARAGFAGAQRHGAAWGGDITGRHFDGPRARHRSGAAQRDPGPAARGLSRLAVLGLGHRRLLRIHQPRGLRALARVQRLLPDHGDRRRTARTRPGRCRASRASTAS